MLIPRNALPSIALAARRFPATARILLWLIAVLSIAGATLADDAAPTQVNRSLRERSIAVLRRVMDREERWIKVHAAEYLLQAGYPEGVKDAFLLESSIHGTEPQYRIGIWRVLARAAENEQEQAKWISNIRDVFLDPKAPDRSHAAETLA